MATRNNGKNNVNIHQGHRQRVRQRVLVNGFDSLPEHELVELLLFYAIPRRNVNPLAHELLNAFGGMSGLFNATMNDLHEKTNLSDKTGNFIISYGELVKEYILSREED